MAAVMSTVMSTVSDDGRCGSFRGSCPYRSPPLLPLKFLCKWVFRRQLPDFHGCMRTLTTSMEAGRGRMTSAEVVASTEVDSGRPHLTPVNFPPLS